MPATTAAAMVSSKTVRSNASERRVAKELTDYTLNPNASISVFPTADDICFWRVLIV